MLDAMVPCGRVYRENCKKVNTDQGVAHVEGSVVIDALPLLEYCETVSRSLIRKIDGNGILKKAYLHHIASNTEMIDHRYI